MKKFIKSQTTERNIVINTDNITYIETLPDENEYKIYFVGGNSIVARDYSGEISQFVQKNTRR